MTIMEARSTIKLYQRYGNRVIDDSSGNSPSTRFVNTANRDFGAYEIAMQ